MCCICGLWFVGSCRRFLQGVIWKQKMLKVKACKSCFWCIRGNWGWVGWYLVSWTFIPLQPHAYRYVLCAVCWGWGHNQQSPLQEGDEKIRGQEEACQSGNRPRRTVLGRSCPGWVISLDWKCTACSACVKDLSVQSYGLAGSCLLQFVGQTWD